MKKRITALALILCMVMALTGCMEMKVQDKVTKDGTCTNTVVLYIEKEALVDYVNRKLGSDNFADMEKELLGSGYTLHTIDEKDYYVSEPEVTKKTIAGFAKTNRLETLNGEYQIWETGLYMNEKAMADEFSLDSPTLSGAGMDKETEELYEKSYLEYKVVFDYDIIETDAKAEVSASDKKTAVWRMTFKEFMNMSDLHAYCASDITVSGVTQGATYKGTQKVNFTGATSATYKGKSVKSGAKYKTHGQHTIVLKAASGEQRTVTFFIDNKKPVVKGIKNKKTYKKAKWFTVSDKHSGIASVKINGKKKSVNSIYYDVKKKGKNKIVVKDKVGNVTKITITIKKKKKK